MTELTTLGDLLQRLATRGDAPAVIAHGRKEPVVWSARELAERSRAFAAGLCAAGVADREPVALLAPNRPDWLPALLGIIGARALAVPISDQITDHELERILEHSGAQWLVTVAKHLPRLVRIGIADRLRVVLLDDAEPDDDTSAALTLHRFSEVQGDPATELPELGPDDPAALLFTSGTTGTPKGVPLTHGNLCTNIEALLAERLAGPKDRVLLPLPFHHAYPLTVGLLTSLATGTTIVIPAGLTGPQIAAALNGSACTIVLGVPRLYEALLDGLERRLHEPTRIVLGLYRGLLTLSSFLRRRFGIRAAALPLAPLRRRLGPQLRLMVSGGARLDPAVAYKLEGLGFEVLSGYGLTETAPILTFNPPGRAHLGTAGLPVPGVELRFDRSEAKGDDDGEILARGPNVFDGYWRNEEATKASFTDDGFYRTGDLGFQDEAGYLHIVGRAKELIVLSGGKKIVPEEVEAVLGGPGIVAEVALLEREGRLIALAVPDRKAARGGDIEEQVRNAIGRSARSLPGYQRPAEVAVSTAALPRTPIGKLRRHELPELFARAREGRSAHDRGKRISEADRALLETPPNDRLWPWLEERFPDQRLTPDTSPGLDLGVDSFEWMNITTEIEERFGVHLGEEAIVRIDTLRDLLNEVIQAEPAGDGAGEVEPSAEDLRRIEPPGRLAGGLALALFRFERLLFRPLFRLRIEGIERIPAEGPLLITPNHLSYLDPFALAAALPDTVLRRLWWAGTTDILFQGPLTRTFSRLFRVIPVDPGRGGVWRALGLGRVILERGDRLVWFPEGVRSVSGDLQTFQPGVAWLIERTGVTVLPVRLEGTHGALPPGRRRLRLAPVLVRFGPPLRPREFVAAADGAGEDHAAQAAFLRETIRELASAEER